MMPTFQIIRNTTDGIPFAAGQVIFRAGDPGDVMYVVVEGAVDIRLDQLVLETVTEGGILGEMALIDQAPRSATAVAVTDCLLATIDARRFMALVKQMPSFSLQVMRVMAQRMRQLHRHL